MDKIDIVLDAVVDVIGHVRGIADSLQTIADVLAENKSTITTGSQHAKIPEKTNTKPKKEKSKTYTLEEVRGILAEKSQAGFSADVKTLITKFGADRLSEIDANSYAELVKEAEEIGNE